MISLPFNALVPLLEPTSKCVRTKSRAVRNGRLMDVMRSRTKAEKRKRDEVEDREEKGWVASKVMPVLENTKR